MRSFVLLGLVWLFNGVSEAAEPSIAKSALGSPVTVEGFGSTAEEARNNALRHLVEQLQAKHRVSLDLVMLERHGRLQFSEAERKPDLLELVPWRVQLTFTPTREWLQALENLQREQRAQERQWWLGRIIACLVLVFAVLAGYLQLEEWTRGFATRWLRALALSVLLLGVFLLWWVR